MADKAPAKVSGFEFDPKGALLSQVIVDDSPYGYAYERAIGYEKQWHAHDLLNLAFPRGSSVIRFRSKSGQDVKVDQYHFMAMPRDVQHHQAAETSVWDNFALFPRDVVLTDLGGEEIVAGLPELTVYRRSTLLNDVIDKLFHETILCRRPWTATRSTYVFAIDLVLDEIRGRHAAPKKSSTEGDGQGIYRVLRYVENHLFEDLEPDLIAQKMGFSRASLYRHFKELTQQSLMSYIRQRRMEEARTLLKSKRYNVSDIAQLVGYDDSYAFSTIYKKVFGASPTKDPAAQASD